MKVIFVLFTLLSSLLSLYTSNQALDASYSLHWGTDATYLYLKIKAKTNGWIGFGIAEPTSGSMPGADMLIGYVHDDGTAKIEDRYATKFGTPSLDDCQSWELVRGAKEDGWRILEVKRKLKAGEDTQDRDILPGMNRVIWAIGYSMDFAQHESRGMTTVVFHGKYETPNVTKLLEDPNVKVLNLFNNNTEILPKITNYVNIDFTFDLPPSHILGLEYVLDPESYQFVHHFVVFGRKNSSKGNGGSILWAWAPGINHIIFPEDVGYRIGNDTITVLQLQTHYHNPKLISGKIDNSGIKVYYTTKLKKYDAGVLLTGDVTVTQPQNITQGTGLAEFEYDCPVECTNQWNQPIHVIFSFLHMHQRGSIMWSTLWRNGTESLINRVEYYQFELQQQTPLELTILPGDRISVHCVYDRDPTRNTVFGPGSSDEMCVQYMAYYPKVQDDFCGFSYNKKQFSNYTFCNKQRKEISNPSVRDPIVSLEKRFGKKNPNFHCNAEKTDVKHDTEKKVDDMGKSIILFIVGGITFIIIAFIAYVLIKKKRDSQVKYFDDNSESGNLF